MILFFGSWWLINTWTTPKPTPTASESEIAIISNDVANVPGRELVGDKIAFDIRGLRISNISLQDYAATARADENSRVTLLSGASDFAEIGLSATGTTAPDVKTVWKETDNKIQKNGTTEDILRNEIHNNQSQKNLLSSQVD